MPRTSFPCKSTNQSTYFEGSPCNKITINFTKNRNKVIKGLIYFALLIITLLQAKKGNKTIIFNFPIFPSLEFRIQKFFGLKENILIIHNSNYRHGEARSNEQKTYEKYVNYFKRFIIHTEKTEQFLKRVKGTSEFSFVRFEIPYEALTEYTRYKLPKSVSILYCLLFGIVRLYKGLDLLINAIESSRSLNSNQFVL